MLRDARAGSGTAASRVVFLTISHLRLEEDGGEHQEHESLHKADENFQAHERQSRQCADERIGRDIEHLLQNSLTGVDVAEKSGCQCHGAYADGKDFDEPYKEKYR